MKRKEALELAIRSGSIVSFSGAKVAGDWKDFKLTSSLSSPPVDLVAINKPSVSGGGEIRIMISVGGLNK